MHRSPSCKACEAAHDQATLVCSPLSTAAGIPAQRAQRALDLASSCRSLLVVGSSLAVWSAFRLAKAAAANGAQVAIVTAGTTRADDLATLKVEGRAGEVLTRLAAHPSLGVPPVY